MGNKGDQKIEKALREYLLRRHPEEELQGYMLGAERPSFWLEALLLGPIASAIATRSYYIGLTARRIVLIPLSWLTSKPTDVASEILLGQIAKMEQKMRWFTGNLKIHYGENVRRRFVFNWLQQRNVKNFVDTFELLPKPMLTEEEKVAAAAAEAAYKEEANSRMTLAVVVLVVVVIIALCLAFGGSRY
jgi:hypothetical protein